MNTLKRYCWTRAIDVGETCMTWYEYFGAVLPKKSDWRAWHAWLYITTMDIAHCIYWSQRIMLFSVPILGASVLTSWYLPLNTFITYHSIPSLLADCIFLGSHGSTVSQVFQSRPYSVGWPVPSAVESSHWQTATSKSTFFENIIELYSIEAEQFSLKWSIL